MGSRRKATNIELKRGWGDAWNANKHFDCITRNYERNMERCDFSAIYKHRKSERAEHDLIANGANGKPSSAEHQSVWENRKSNENSRGNNDSTHFCTYALYILCTKLKCFYLLDFTYLLFYCWCEDLFWVFFSLLKYCVVKGKPVRNYKRTFFL